MTSPQTVTALKSERPSKYQRRQGEVIDAAAAVFAEKGYHGGSTSDIADRLGIRQGSLYYYFASKEAALEIVCQKAVEGLLQGLDKILVEEDDPAKMVTLAIRNHLEPLRDRREYIRVFQRERTHLPECYRRKVNIIARRYEAMLQSIFEEGVRLGQFRPNLDCRLSTLALLGMLNGVSLWYGRENEATLERTIEEFSSQVLTGVRT